MRKLFRTASNDSPSEPTNLTVGNGGDGLVLVGGRARPYFTFPAITRFVFVRP